MVLLYHSCCLLKFIGIDWSPHWAVMNSFDLGLGATVTVDGRNKVKAMSIGQNTEDINNILIL